MKIIIDILLLVIIAVCTWGGYKKGLIGGVASILAIIIALFGGSLLSSAYSHEVIPALKPFIDGYMDSQKNKDAVLESIGYGDSDLSLNDILAEDSSLRYDYAYESLVQMGFYEKRAEELADRAVELAEAEKLDMTEAVVNVLCDTVTYVGGLVIAFLLILILLIALGNIVNLSFRLPNMDNLDEIGGTVLGFVKGFIYCVLLCWLLSFLGFILGRDTLSDATLARFFLAFKFITNGLI